MESVINTAKVVTATVFVNEMITQRFCANCAIRHVAAQLSLNRHEVNILTDVITVCMLQPEVKEANPLIVIHA